ncbi:latrophilin receptor-like protein A [Homalodisca vitripennis]|uniref:latrophilin receptor-like protein A n=1 Tax=Homalodisca vitripennis TaxID=197043 RepID=UPI001EE9BE4F|nr:latrophilin receptor-like protein A [Homalodisca vitripennis]
MKCVLDKDINIKEEQEEGGGEEEYGDDYDNDGSEIFIIAIMFLIVVCLGVLSVVSLILTLVAYITIPQLHNLQGRLIISYLLSLAMFYSVLYYSLLIDDTSRCLNYILQFSYLSFFSWLLVLCKDIGDMVKNPLESRPLGKPYWCIYLNYSLFGWGVPFLFTVLTVSVGVVPHKSDSCYQQDPCFFDMDRTDSLFMEIPSIAMVEINFIIFLSLVWNLRSHFRQTEGISSQHARENVEGFFLYLKLAFVTGLNWFLFMCLLKITSLKNDINAFIMLSLFNSQGLVLSALLICNKKVCKSLWSKCCC